MRLGHLDDEGRVTVAGVVRCLQADESAWFQGGLAIAKIGVPMPSAISLRRAALYVSMGLVEPPPLAGFPAKLTPFGQAVAEALRPAVAPSDPPQPSAPAVSAPSDPAARRRAELAALGWDV